MYALKRLFVQDKLYFTASIVLGILSYFVPQAENFITGKLIDQVVGQIAVGQNAINTNFWVLLGLLVFALFSSKIFYDVWDLVGRILAFRISIYRERLTFYKFLTLSPQVFEDPEFIKEKTKLDWNDWKLGDNTLNFMYGIASFISLGALIVIFAQYDVRVVIALFASIIPYAIVNIFFGKRVWGIWDSAGQDKILYNSYREFIFSKDPNKYQELAVMDYGKYLLDKSHDFMKKFNDKLESNEKRRFKFATLMRFFEYAGVGLALFFMFDLLATKTITIGDFYFVSSVFYNMRGGIKDLFQKYINIQGDSNVFETFYKLMNMESPIPMSSGTAPFDGSKPVSVEFKDVWFKYPGSEKWIFEGISFKLSSDEDVALVGKNGAGKSTLIKLLLRIYDPQKGTILINGEDIRNLNLKMYYKTVGILSQQFNQLHLQAWENVFVGDIARKPNMSQVIEASKQADAHEFISKYPKKYKTYMSREIENGIMPSGGQWQKIAIARVFYRNPKFIILDEPTSAIDAIAEEQIFNNIQKMAEDKTVLIVSHRFATVKKAKRIVVLDEGKIVEQGTHKQLLANNGLYAEMYTKQQS